MLRGNTLATFFFKILSAIQYDTEQTTDPKMELRRTDARTPYNSYAAVPDTFWTINSKFPESTEPAEYMCIIILSVGNPAFFIGETSLRYLCGRDLPSG